MHPLEKLLPNFTASEKQRRQSQPADAAQKVGGANFMVGAAADEPEVEITAIDDGHTPVVGAPMQTIEVPIGKNDGGETLYIDHQLWPDLDPSLTGDARTKALLAVIEQLARQGELSDCWALTAFNVAILNNYDKLKERMIPLNGRIAVYGFYLGDKTKPLTFTMDYNLGNVGVSVGPAGCIAYKAFEKLFAFARYLKLQADGTVANMYDADYTRTNGGWMSEVYRLIYGMGSYRQVSANPFTGQNLVNLIQSNAKAGFGVSVGTVTPTKFGRVAGHAYGTIIAAIIDAVVRLYSIDPWGVPYPPMYREITAENATDFFNAVVVVDGSKAYDVPRPIQPSQPIPGDANGDGVADFADFVILSNHYGLKTPNGAQDGDFNGDGVVNFADFVILSNNYNTRAGALPADFPPKETIMPTAKITGTDHDGGAHSWDSVRVNFVAIGGTPAVTVAPSPPKPPAIDASGTSASFPMPIADATITLNVTAPDGTKATDTRVVKLSVPAPTPTPTPTPAPSPTTLTITIPNVPAGVSVDSVLLSDKTWRKL